jgi:OmcA/MtrC family decaheme c-type cytochrome
MRSWRWGVAVGAFATAAMLGVASCGDDDDDGGGGAAPPQVDADPVSLDIQAATVPEFASTARPTVTFRVLDGSGAPIDLEAELATTATFPNMRSSGARAPTFTLAMLDDNGDYVSYYSTTRVPDSRGYTYIPDPDVVGTLPVVTEQQVKDAHPPRDMTQATSVASALGPNLTVVGERTYRFTFPAPTTDTGGMDRTKTHTVAGWLVRKPNQTDSDIGFDSFNFVPAGGTAQLDQVIADDTCNRCHGQLTAHGTRRGTQFCLTCHSPQTGDPDTGQTVDFKVMIHKIHYGSGLPSVRQGGPAAPYYIVGNSQSVHDWSDVAFPWHDHGVQHCTVCHAGGEDSGNWRTKPTLATCTSCHDNVQFADAAALTRCADLPAGQSFQNCRHSGGEITVSNPNEVTSCQGCHGVGSIAPIDQFHHGD